MAKKLTSAKAKEILHDKSVHGHPLTDKQRRFFGAIAGGAQPLDNGGWLDNYPQAQNGIEGTMGGLTDKGFNYNGAWGGTMQMGGSLPGSVGFMYARTQSPAPSNGKYAKKTKASAQNGKEMKFYQEGLDFTPKSISKDGGWLSKYDDGGVIEDDMGQWAHPGLVTKINSNQITMKGVEYPVLGISDTGDTQMMQPGEDYKFDGKSVTEYPIMQNGGFTPINLREYNKNIDTSAKKDSTKVVQPKKVSKQEANFNKFKLEQANRERQHQLALRGQSDASNFASDLGTGLLQPFIDPLQPIPTTEQYEANRTGNWMNRTGMASQALGNYLGGEMIGAGMTKVAPYVAKALTTPSVGKPTQNLGEDLMEGLHGLRSLAEESYGKLFRNKANKEAIAEGNQWLKDWIQHPATQAKIESDLGFVKDRKNIVKDIYDFGYAQAKNFEPISKEYPLYKQFVEPKTPIHQNNLGVSYTHSYAPIERHMINRGDFYVNNPRYGSWISRTPRMSYADRVGTTIHEGTHDWTSDWLLDRSGQKDFLLSNLDPNLHTDWENWTMDPKGFKKQYGKARTYQAYMADPTEQHARIMELRKHFNLTPDDIITSEQASDMINQLNAIPKKQQPIDVSGFLNSISNNPDNLSGMFNRLWATSPYIAPVGIAAGVAKANQKENGGWLNKYE